MVEVSLTSLSNCISLGPRSNGLVVRAVVCEARGPGFDSSSDQVVFPLLGGRNLIDPDMINCMILRIQVDKINNNNS